jgi:hypothetical protein
MQRTLVEAMLNLHRAPYAWTIDNYPITKPDDDDDYTFQAEPDGKVLQGPGNAPDDVFTLFEDASVGEKFRMLDGDGIPYFEGRILIPGDSDSGDGSGDVHEAPMWDLGEAYGCAEIQYLKRDEDGNVVEPHEWETF